MENSEDASGAHEGTTPEGPAEVLTPIPGPHLDPPPRPKPAAVRRLERQSRAATVAWKAFERFRAARSPLISGGTAYYLFLAMFSVLAVAYGVAALVGADVLAEWLTSALEEALPGLVGEEGIDPETLTQVGRTTSLVGLLVMVWSGTAGMGAVSDALHHIYGAAPDGRNPLARRGHLLGWLALLGPLVLLSYTLTTAATGFGHRLLDSVGIESALAQFLVLLVAVVVTFVLDVGVVGLALGRLGGIRPTRGAILAGAVAGAVLIGLLKVFMAAVISWAVAKPQYGAFALPIAVLVVFWLQAMALYGAAALTAAVAETQVRSWAIREPSARRPGPRSSRRRRRRRGHG